MAPKPNLSLNSSAKPKKSEAWAVFVLSLLSWAVRGGGVPVNEQDLLLFSELLQMLQGLGALGLRIWVPVQGEIDQRPYYLAP